MKYRPRLLLAPIALGALLLLSLLACRTAPSPAPSPPGTDPAQGPPLLRFAVIGDYGTAGPAEAAVAELVHSWQPDLIITTGDNNYPNGAVETIDANIGQYYSRYIGSYKGAYGPGAQVNRFFPSPGNHDWDTGSLQPYVNYFNLPGNERYYAVRRGPVHFFALDSDEREPDGISADSEQGRWLQGQLNASSAPWRIVYFHHPPYSSARHGSSRIMRWPFAQWGATAVLAGHDHVYERLDVDGTPYFVNGLGGRRPYSFRNLFPLRQSQVRFNDAHGAMLVEAWAERITFRFVTQDGELIDYYALES
ncbi:MAG: metallophosphoesterase [Candidatus Promineifilaceae bacterium]|nr:metallophosphoesterase [Candidatus Promineifilaceae bacterium]